MQEYSTTESPPQWYTVGLGKIEDSIITIEFADMPSGKNYSHHIDSIAVIDENTLERYKCVWFENDGTLKATTCPMSCTKKSKGEWQ